MDPKITVCQAGVVFNKQVAKGIWKLELKLGDDFGFSFLKSELKEKINPRWDDNSIARFLADHYYEFILPGQFVCLAPLDSDSAMARPFSVYDFNFGEHTISLLYKVVGSNTEAMTKLVLGDQVKFWGPLGTGWIPDDENYYDEIWLVGGGIGIAPLLYYQDVLGTISNWEKVIRFFGGSQTQDDVAMELVDEDNFIIATDDGSLGYHGYVTDFLGDCLKAMMTPRILVITCGPNVMMKKVAELCRQREGADCRVILETIMACGLNNCKGCSIKTTTGMKSVCHDGPVFNAKEVLWDELG